MPREVTTFLMYEGKAEEAMSFYVSLFPGSEVTRVEKYGPGEPGKEGSVKKAEFTLAGHRLACIDTARSGTPSHSRRPSRSSSSAEMRPNSTGRSPRCRKAGR